MKDIVEIKFITNQGGFSNLKLASFFGTKIILKTAQTS